LISSPYEPITNHAANAMPGKSVGSVRDKTRPFQVPKRLNTLTWKNVNLSNSPAQLICAQVLANVRHKFEGVSDNDEASNRDARQAADVRRTCRIAAGVAQHLRVSLELERAVLVTATPTTGAIFIPTGRAAPATRPSRGFDRSV
jgi:hypothetical protein